MFPSKMQVVKLALEEGLSQAEVGRRLQLTSGQISQWVKRTSKDGAKALRLAPLIAGIYQRRRGCYGSPRIAQVLRGMGESCSIASVARCMSQAGLYEKTKRKFRHTRDSRHRLPLAANKLDQNFRARAPGQKLVGDITDIHTEEGALYLAAVMDFF